MNSDKEKNCQTCKHYVYHPNAKGKAQKHQCLYWGGYNQIFGQLRNCFGYSEKENIESGEGVEE